jgi:asparagine synthase (glutamine-hydrolysing)
MCGIAGIINLNQSPINKNQQEILKIMMDEIAYRGPDDEQYYIKNNVGLGFRRLSIIDIKNGQQPLQNEDKSIIVLANGEIYNYKELRGRLEKKHRFQSNSDCEVIVHLYEEKGINFLEDLIGMYAISIWDRRYNKVILARDRFGIKPLYYTYNGNVFTFASEIKALIRSPNCPKEFDWETALSDPWLSGYVSTNLNPPVSYFKGVEQLPAGTYLEINICDRTMYQKKYWDIETKIQKEKYNNKDVDYWICGYKELLKDSIEKCLQSDVEIGLFLSGGIDSAAIAGIASKRENFHTFSVLSQSTFTNEDAKYAHLISKTFNLPNHQVIFDWQDNELLTPQCYKHLLWITETPFCGPEQFYKYNLHKYAKHIRPNIKVILTGQGSDEFNGGYSRMFAPEDEKNWNGFISSLNILERNRIISSLKTNINVWEEHFVTNPISTKFLKNLGDNSNLTPWQSYTLTKYRDLQMYNCWHEDRIAAANHIENRVPFLDHRLVEWIFSIPEELHPKLLWDKKILREAIKEYLPKEYCNREKVPFFYGKDVKYTHRMMLNLLNFNNSELLQEAFLNEYTENIIDFDKINVIFKNIQEDPEAYGTEFLLRLVNMGLLSNMINQKTVLESPQDKILTAINGEWTDIENEVSSRFNKHKEINLEHVPSFKEGVKLVKLDNNKVENDLYYIVVNNIIEFSLSRKEVGEWIDVLQNIDGNKTLNQILIDTNIKLSNIAKYLKEAIDFELIVLQDFK